MEPSGLLLYNGRLNERHDFLAVEIIQGQVQLKYSTGRLGPAYRRIHAVGAARRSVLSGEGEGLLWMKLVLRETVLREVLENGSGWHGRQVCVSGPSLGLGVQVPLLGCEQQTKTNPSEVSAAILPCYVTVSFAPCLAVSQSGEEDAPAGVSATLLISSLLPFAISVPTPCPSCLPWGLAGLAARSPGLSCYQLELPVLLPSPLHIAPGCHPPALIAPVSLGQGKGRAPWRSAWTEKPYLGAGCWSQGCNSRHLAPSPRLQQAEASMLSLSP